MGAICGLGYYTNLSGSGEWTKLTEDNCQHDKGANFGEINITNSEVKAIGLIVQYRCDWFLGCNVRFVAEIGDNVYELGSYPVSGKKWVVTKKFIKLPSSSFTLCKIKAYENNSLVDYVSFDININIQNPPQTGGGSSGSGGGSKEIIYVPQSGNNNTLLVVGLMLVAAVALINSRKSRG